MADCDGFAVLLIGDNGHLVKRRIEAHLSSRPRVDMRGFARQVEKDAGSGYVDGTP